MNKTSPKVLVRNLDVDTAKVFHLLYSNGDGVLHAGCSYSEGKPIQDVDVIVHRSHAEKFADPCSYCYPEKFLPSDEEVEALITAMSDLTNQTITLTTDTALTVLATINKAKD